MISSPPINPERYQFFPPSYAIGRDWFESMVVDAQAKYWRFEKPDTHGPDGGPLSIDCAWFGSPRATKVYLTLSGTHGQEYFCGAAGQFQWLRSGGPSALRDDVAVCLVHAVNPFGAAHLSRTNDQLVDLNRNFRDHSTPRPPNAVFNEVASLFALERIDDFTLYDIVTRFETVQSEHDTAEVMTAIAGGQDKFPTGPAYCGNKPEWEARTLSGFVADQFQDVRQVALIDWHTGLGPFGAASPLFDHPEHSPSHERAVSWWGAPPGSDALYEGGTSPNIEGELRAGLASILEDMGAETVHAVVEIGTVDNRAIIPAFAIDRWLRVECSDPNSAEAVRLRTLMMERYSPSLPEWREKALKSMNCIYAATLSGLENWSIATAGEERPVTQKTTHD